MHTHCVSNCEVLAVLLKNTTAAILAATLGGPEISKCVRKSALA